MESQLEKHRENYDTLKKMIDNDKYFPTNMIYSLARKKFFEHNGKQLSYMHIEYFLIRENINDDYSKTIRGFAIQLTGENSGQIVKYSRENHFDMILTKKIPEITVYSKEDGKNVTYFDALYFCDKFENIREHCETSMFYKKQTASIKELQDDCEKHNSFIRNSKIEKYENSQPELETTNDVDLITDCDEMNL